MVSKKILASGAFGHRHESVLPTQAIIKEMICQLRAHTYVLLLTIQNIRIFVSIVGNTVIEPMEVADNARLTIDCYMNKKDSLL